MKRNRMITFCEYMKQSLGGKDGGYYTSRGRIGFEGGDFFTAPETSSAFASLLALQIMEADRALGYPDPFYMIEAGPGNGTLAVALLTVFKSAAPDLYNRIAPFFYELPGVLQERQKERLASFNMRYPPRWILPTVLKGEDADDVQPESGIIFGNEFLDALPVHRVRGGIGGWEECYVNQSGDRPEPVWGPLSSEKVEREVREVFGPNDAEMQGQEVELCLMLQDVLARLDRFLKRGFMLWIDYGDIRDELYSGRRKSGTLLSYKNHKVTDNLLEGTPGESDLTAFVDFTRVARSLSALDYSLEGYTDQMSWLMGLGFPEWIEANANRLSPEEIIQSGILVHPLKMGRIFKVLLMKKGTESCDRTGFRFGGLRPPL